MKLFVSLQASKQTSRWPPKAPLPPRPLETCSLPVLTATDAASLRISRPANSYVRYVSIYETTYGYVICLIMLILSSLLISPHSLLSHLPGVSQTISPCYLHLLSLGIPSYQVSVSEESVKCLALWVDCCGWLNCCPFAPHALRNSLEKESRPACDRCSRDFKQYGTVR